MTAGPRSRYTSLYPSVTSMYSRWLRDPVTDTIGRIRRRWRAGLTRTVRLTGAAALAYVVAAQALPDPQPLLAPLTALLIVQVTLVGTIADSLRRIVSVVAGVLLAVGFSSVVPFSVVSLTAVIAASIIVGLVLRLGPHLLEVPISAMLVLGVNGAETAAASRITETLVGAAVGLLVNLVFPPAVQNRTAGAAVEAFAIDLAELLERVAGDVTGPITREQAQRWLEEARRLSIRVPQLEQTVIEADRSRRLNARALGLIDADDALRTGLNALEHSAVALRALYRALVDEVGDRAELHPDEPTLYDADIREVFSVLLRDLATALRGFGAYVRDEADDIAVPHPEQLVDTMESVAELRARLTDLLLVDARGDRHAWELHGAMLLSIERVLGEVDIEARVRQRDRRLQRAEDERNVAVVAVDRLRTATRGVTGRGFRRGSGRRP